MVARCVTSSSGSGQRESPDEEVLSLKREHELQQTRQYLESISKEQSPKEKSDLRAERTWVRRSKRARLTSTVILMACVVASESCLATPRWFLERLTLGLLRKLHARATSSKVSPAAAAAVYRGTWLLLQTTSSSQEDGETPAFLSYSTTKTCVPNLLLLLTGLLRATMRHYRIKVPQVCTNGHCIIPRKSASGLCLWVTPFWGVCWVFGLEKLSIVLSRWYGKKATEICPSLQSIVT